jgi:protein-tyrosine-phosphatase
VLLMKRVLFVCVENSNRSQMAEAFARMLGGADVERESAGSRPSGDRESESRALHGGVGYDLDHASFESRSTTSTASSMRS